MQNLFHLFNSNLTVAEGLIYSVLGIAIVFFALILLMIVIKVMEAIFMSVKKHNEKVAEALKKTAITPARGSAGELTLIGVTEEEAAIIMAIVADKLGKPLNKLCFKSIREEKPDEL